MKRGFVSLFLFLTFIICLAGSSSTFAVDPPIYDWLNILRGPGGEQQIVNDLITPREGAERREYTVDEYDNIARSFWIQGGRSADEFGRSVPASSLSMLNAVRQTLPGLVLNEFFARIYVLNLAYAADVGSSLEAEIETLTAGTASFFLENQENFNRAIRGIRAFFDSIPSF